MRIEIVKIEESAVIEIESEIVIHTEGTGIGNTSKCMLLDMGLARRPRANILVMIGEEKGIDRGHRQSVGFCRMSYFVEDPKDGRDMYASIDTCCCVEYF